MYLWGRTLLPELLIAAKHVVYAAAVIHSDRMQEYRILALKADRMKAIYFPSPL